MRRLTSIAILLFLLIPDLVISQENFRTDISGNKYTWQSTEVKKISSDGQILYSWQNPQGGFVKWIDPLNPFKILIYSDETKQIVWLNNKLSPIGDAISAESLKLVNPIGICSSKDGGIWVVDAGTSQLIKYDRFYSRQIETPVRMLANAKNMSWIQLMEWKDYLAILIPGESLWIADLYGQVIKKLGSKGTLIHFSPDGILVESPTSVDVYRPDTGQFSTLIKKP